MHDSKRNSNYYEVNENKLSFYDRNPISGYL